MKQAVVFASKTHYEILFTELRDSKVRVTAALRRHRSGASLFEEVCAAALPFSEMLILISKDQVTVRLLELPTTDAQEIRDIIGIQAGKQTPFPKDEIVWDYRITESSKHGYTKVLLSVVQKEKIEVLCRDLSKAAHVNAAVGLDCEYLAGWNHFRGSEEAYGVIDWTLDGIDFTVVKSGMVVFTKLLQIDASVDHGPDWEGQLVSELRFAMAGYQTDHAAPPIEKVAVHASAAIFDRLHRVLTGKLSIETLHAPACPPGTEISKEAAGMFKEFTDAGITFAKLLGAAGRRSAVKKFEFTPAAIRSRHESRKRSRRVLLTAALAGLFGLSLLAVSLERELANLLRLNALTRMERELARNAGPLAEVDRRIQFVKARLANSSVSASMLDGIGAATPAGVYLTEFAYDERGEAALRGTAAAPTEVYQYVKNLEGLRRFAAVKTRYVNKRAVESGEVVDFEIVCTLKERLLGAPQS